MSIYKNNRENPLSAVILCAAALMCGCSRSSAEYASRDFFAFDTFVSVTSYDDDFDMDSLEMRLCEISDELQSVYGADANTLSGEYISECAELSSVLSKEIGGGINITCGALTELWGISSDNPHVPAQDDIYNALATICGGFESLETLPSGTRLDLGASAKGYACGKAAELLEESGVSGGIVSMGSSLLLFGEKPDGSSFKSAVRNPENSSEYIGIVETSAAYVSTSGGYERYFEENGKRYEHILSPETGYPVETDLTSVTVIIPYGTENGGILSDLLSTAIYAEGTAGLEHFMGIDYCSIIAADKNKNLYVSNGVDFTLYESSGYRLSQ
ncbi:MAG: FAD:protein FMN transferase [Oscillospiraceae bacterium]|nr:FAD:protein FMN transferase [Oscillospiraceae bacterium]